jgi:EmrB/QacA subfamily drug resistance transporter
VDIPKIMGDGIGGSMAEPRPDGRGTAEDRANRRRAARNLDATGVAEDYVPDPKRWKALTVCLVAGFMTLLDLSIVNVALPSIRSGLHAAQSELSWVLSGYALTFGLALVPAGRLGDARGRRRMFVIGVAGFTISSAVCGIAPTGIALVCARLVQGLAGGFITPQVSGLIQQLFRGAERGRAFGLLGATIGISTAVGPLLGGLIIATAGTQEGWRWVFYVNIPIGALAIVLAFRLIPGSLGKQNREELDLFGAVLLGVGVAAILLPLIQSQESLSPLMWLLVPLGVVILAGFLAWERHYSHNRASLVDLSLFQRKSYAYGASIGLAYFAGFTPVFFIFTLFLQNGLHYSPLQAGLAVTPFAVGSAVAAAIGGRIVSRFGRPLVVVGLITVGIGLAGTILAVELVPGRHAGLATALPLLVAGIGSGNVISPNQTLTLNEVPVQGAGSAGAVVQTGQRLGSALGIALVGAVFFDAVSRGHGAWDTAYREGIAVCICFVAVALAAAILDVLRRGSTPPGDAVIRPATIGAGPVASGS